MCDISGVVNNVFPIAVQRRSVWARGSTIAALLGLTLHAALALNAARRLSPTWDEIAAPASGLAQLQTGALTLNTVNPFLSRLFYALPLTVQGATLPWDHPAWRERDEYRFGFQYTFRNRVAPQRLIVASRLVAVLFSLGVGILLFLRTKAVWGPLGGAVAVWAYGATPILASRASIAMAEMPMYFFILLALAFHTRREKKRDAASLWATGLCAGLALLPIVVRGHAPGQEIEHPMSLVILGGLVTSTALNLLILPALYLRFARPMTPEALARRETGEANA